MTDAPLGEPFDLEVSAWADAFRRDPSARAVMGVARRAGLPFSEVLDRWSEVDLAMELAWDLYLAADREARCGACGTRNDEMIDEDGRDVPEPVWKLEARYCRVCDLRGDLDERSRKRNAGRDGTRIEVARRAPGEPVLPQRLLEPPRDV